ncbi:hypothetical protein O3P69_006299 [Scylla paramamosain]|uniref:Uncharacterized protein n=1 Tax=Scylla paramamosain TaxID=85552 RepID=A0AAW0U5D3_SCYPA
MARVGVLLFLVCALVSCVAAQKAPSTAVQNPGMLDRIMQDYLNPLREYDWVGTIRRLLDSVRNYVVPEGKEPKSGHVLLDVLSLAAAHLDSRLASRPSRGMQEEGRYYNLNENVSPSLAAYSWNYLGILWLYAGLSIVGALVPLYKYIPEEELLYPDYEFEEEEKAVPEMGMDMGMEMEDTPAMGDGQNYYGYDYDYGDAEGSDMSSSQRPMAADQNNGEYNYQDYSSTGNPGYTNGYPPPNYYGIQYYPPPRN